MACRSTAPRRAKGDLTLTATRGDLILGAASRQQADGTLTATAGGALQALGSTSAGRI